MRSPHPPPAFMGVYTINCGQLQDIAALKSSIKKASEILANSTNIVETAANVLALNDLIKRLTKILTEARLYG